MEIKSLMKTKEKIKKYFFVLVLFVSTTTLFAHQPDLSATLLIQQEDNSWVVQVRAALTAFEYEVENTYGKDAYATPEEFRNLVIQYFQEHLQVGFNESHPIPLENGTVDLGHESSVSFVLQRAPADITSLTVLNRGFHDINSSQSVLSIYKKDYKRTQFLLNEDNQYTVKLNLVASRFLLSKHSEENRGNFLSNIWPGLLFLSLGLVIIVGKRKRILR